MKLLEVWQSPNCGTILLSSGVQIRMRKGQRIRHVSEGITSYESQSRPVPEDILKTTPVCHEMDGGFKEA